MKALQKVEANGNGDHPPTPARVAHLRGLLGLDALMLPWPRGSKGTKKKWGHRTLGQMRDADYLRELDAGNIGVALGRKSNGLCSIDFDSDEWMERFLKANPALQITLRTRGARGGQVWVRINGDYPASFSIKTLPMAEHPKGEHVGEWRANGSQTIISGAHPSGREYSFIVEAESVRIAFADIVWPEGLRSPKAKLTIAHSHTALSCSHKLSHVVCVEGVLVDVSDFIPTERHQSDSLLWAMAGRMRTFEKHEGRATTNAEKTAIFKAWWEHSEDYVDPAMDYYAYLTKWRGDCERRKFADDETALAAAWRLAQSEPLPADALADYEPPMHEKMQLLVALCFQLQRINNPHPFYLGSRDAEPLLETPQRTVAYWLESLAAEDGPFRILKKVSVGSFATRRTNEWHYQSTLEKRNTT